MVASSGSWRGLQCLVRLLWAAEDVGQSLGVLHQLVRLPDVRQAEPEHGPAAVDKAAVTVLEVPDDVEGKTQQRWDEKR